jgi:hypothetical protein
LTARRGLRSSQRLAWIRVIFFSLAGQVRRRGGQRDAEAAEAERLRDEGKQVVSIGWGVAGKTIEHEAGPLPSDRD